MTDQADMEARARRVLDCAPIGFDRWQEKNIVAIMIRFAAEREAAAYARAAEVARSSKWDASRDEIVLAIEALGEAKG